MTVNTEATPGRRAGRPLYYDRNASKKVLAYANNLGAASLSDGERSAYTVPSNKLAIVELLSLEVRNDGSSAVSGSVALRAVYTPNGGSDYNVVFTSLDTEQAAGGLQRVDVGTQMFMAAGDKIAIRSSADATNTGADITFRAFAMLTEVDA